MAAMEWTEKFSVGIPTFDRQHKKLFELFNTFYDSIHKQEGRERLAFVIKGLKDYTVQHFKSEEASMKLYHYPKYEAHKKEHDAFVKSVLEFENRFNQGKMILTIEITNFIKDWITKHVMEVDKQYTEHLTARGVQ